MQSWGSQSKFNYRHSEAFPTKSGVLGLVCCAMGMGGEQVELLKSLTRYPMDLLAFKSGQSREGGMDMLEDFQMVGSGYSKADPWQDLMIPKKADGKRPVGAGTKLTYRQYILNMAFAVRLELDDDIAVKVVAVKSPTCKSASV